MVLLEVTWIFSFHPQALSLILADRQHWKCWEFSSSPGAVQQLPQSGRWGPLCYPSPPAQRFPEDAQLCPDCPHHGHPAPGEPQNFCRTRGELSGGCPDLAQYREPGPRLSEEWFLFFSSFRRCQTLPRAGIPLGAPIPVPPSSSWHFSPLNFGLVRFAVAFWTLP